MIYFVSPIDLILNTIPIIGYADDVADVAVIAFALKLVADAVRNTRNGKEKRAEE